jgi:proteic killer suppression protein
MKAPLHQEGTLDMLFTPRVKGRSRMIVEFADPGLESLFFGERVPKQRMSRELVRSYRKVVGLLYSASSDQELRAFKSLRLEQLKGSRRGQSSLRLHGGDRLIVSFRTDPQGRVVIVVEIVDYH